MTYRKILDLKFNQKVPTIKLHKNFPRESGKIGRVALAELPVKTLRELIADERELRQILDLKAALKKQQTHS